MARELHSESAPIEQLASVGTDQYAREPEIQLVDRIESNDYAEALAFEEDPVTIRIEPGHEENAPEHHLVQVNGKGAEVLINGQWLAFGYLPVGQQIVVKRKYLGVMLRSKRTRITHWQDEVGPSATNMNIAKRDTMGTMAVSIIHDPSPKAHAWMTELRRRNY